MKRRRLEASHCIEGSWKSANAGPAASTVAATVPFSVGTETEGSLMSPADTCGVTAMRPSLGSIGRSYVMTLADSLVSHLLRRKRTDRRLRAHTGQQGHEFQP